MIPATIAAFLPASLPIGSLANAAAVILGSLIGAMLGSRMPARVQTIVFQALGLCVMVIGLKMALGMDAPILVIFSLLIGAVTGELARLDLYLDSLGDRLKTQLKSNNPRFTEGFVTASLIFCVGSMAIVGAFEEGLRHDPTVLLTKSLLDGFASIALAATYGSGVTLSFLPVLLYQYSLTLFAQSFSGLFTPALMTSLTATGGLMILGIGLNLLEITRIRLSNLLPGLVAVVLLSLLLGQ